MRLFRISLAALALLFALALPCHAAPPPDNPSAKVGNDPRYIQALRALDEGIPQVSIENLSECLAGKISANDRSLLNFQLARAFLAAGRGEDALKAIFLLPASYQASAAELKAQTLATLGRWEDASAIYQQLSAQSNAPLSCRIGAAECLHALGRTQEAIRALEPVVTSGKASVAVRLRLADFYIEENGFDKCEAILKGVQPRTVTESKAKQYIQGRLLLARREDSAALDSFQQLLNNPGGVTENVMTGAALGAAGALEALQGPEVAASQLERSIWKYRDIGGIDVLFRRLDQVYDAGKTPSDSELQKMAADSPGENLSVLATYYLAKAYYREHKTREALATLALFITKNPDHPLVSSACLLQGRILLEQQELLPAEDRDLGAAIKSFEAAMQHAPDNDNLAGAEMWCANAYFEQREFVLAQSMYHDAAQHSERLWQQAVFNSALCWLNQANYDKFWSDYQDLGAHHAKKEMLAELILDEGLLQAKSSDSRAGQTLREFARDFPGHPRVAEARLALAEIAFLQPFPDLDQAADYIKASNQSPETAERAEYLDIFLADAANNRDEAKVVKKCQDFIQNHPSSPLLLANVYMKLGQVYFRNEQWTDAEAQFETLAEKIPTSPLVESALFLAGQAALKTMNTDKARANFDKVGKGNGPLKLYARQQQAIIESSVEPEDAIKLYEYILASKPDAGLKFASLGGKADLCFLLGIKDPKYYDEAITTYDELAKLPEVTRGVAAGDADASYWRDKALYGEGSCYEKLDKTNEALAAFYEVIQPLTLRKGGPEYLWFYKASIAAAHICEDRKQWKSAIAIYKKLAALDGPGSAEARERLTQLRLDHFIYDE